MCLIRAYRYYMASGDVAVSCVVAIVASPLFTFPCIIRCIGTVRMLNFDVYTVLPHHE